MKNLTITGDVENGTLCATLYSTKIVEVSGGTIILRTGGFLTPLTKWAMNKVSEDYKLDFKVFQKNKNFHVTTKSGTYKFYCHVTFSLSSGQPL